MTARGFLLAVFGFASTCLAAPSLTWRTNQVPEKAWIELSGLAAPTVRQWKNAGSADNLFRQVLALYVQKDSIGLSVLDLPPVSGRYELKDDSLAFYPAFPLSAGLHYEAVFDPGALPGGKASELVTARFHIPRPLREPTAVVTQIFPSADTLPENLLKFYVHFSQPMSGGDIYEHISLRDDRGKEVELPFLEIAEELWDNEMTRLTLFIDPGRIKRGVKPLEDIGPALEDGHSFTLRISADWIDAEGTPLKEPFEKKFKITGPDREPPNPEKWKVNYPKPGSHDSLVVDFGEPMDQALTLRLLHATSSEGGRINGKAQLTRNESVWTFTPSGPWPKSKLELAFENTLEDISGNRVGKPFEVDVFDKVERKITRAMVRLPISPGQTPARP